MKVDVPSLTDELKSFTGKLTIITSRATVLPLRRKQQKSQGGILDVYGTDLTQKRRAGELDPVIGRDSEQGRMVTILSRRSKNNPVLMAGQCEVKLLP